MKLHAAIIILLLSVSNPLYPQNIILSDNKLFELKESSLFELKIKPEIKFYSADKSTICYLRNKNNRSQKITIGLYDHAENKILAEKELPYDWKSDKVMKFFYKNGSAYIFMQNIKDQKSAIKINLDDYSLSIYKDLEDFSVISGIPAIIEKKNSEYILRFGNTEIPLAYQNSPKFINIVDERIIIITDGKIYDFIDLQLKRSLFSHNIAENFEDSRYNFEISVIDESSPEKNYEDRLNLYKIYIDGSEAGRTESGSAGIEKKYKDNLTADAYHIIKAELWEINTGKNKYERANNIRQPLPLRIFMPKGRKIKLKVKFDGISYKTTID
jgi:hypothetical protein